MSDQTPDLAALEALASKATPGPWWRFDYECGSGHVADVLSGDGGSDSRIIAIDALVADAAYIAAVSPTTVLWLIREVERLTRWKSEALPVLDGLQELGKALGLPLGERITGPAALAAVEALKLRVTFATLRADKAEATIERVRAALANHPRACEAHPEDDPISCGWKRAVLDVQTALDGGEPDA